MTKSLSPSNQGNEEMERSQEEERQAYRLADLHEETAEVVVLLFCKHPKMKIPYKPIDTKQTSKQSQVSRGGPKSNMEPMQKI